MLNRITTSRGVSWSRPCTSAASLLLFLLALCIHASSASAAPNISLDSTTSGTSKMVREDGKGGPVQILLRVVSDVAVSADLTVYFTLTLPNGDPVGTHAQRYNSVELGSSVVIKAGAKSVDVAIKPVNNDQVDGHLSLKLTLSANAAYTLSTDPERTSATVVINDDETLPTLNVDAGGQQVLTEGDSSSNSATITFRLSGASLYAFSADYVIGGDATRYQLGQPQRFNIGDTQKFQTVTIGNDAESQGDQTLMLTLQESLYYRVGINSGFTLVVRDDDSSAPLANFGLDQVVMRGDTAIVPVQLAGTASHYPVNIPYTIQPGTGTVAGRHYTQPSETQATITTGLSGEIQIPLPATEPADGVNRFIIVRMGEPVNARRGQFTFSTIIIAQTNVQPRVSLSAQQGGRPTRIVTTGGGEVTVTATASDPNGGDTHSYSWSGSSDTLRPTAGDTGTSFLFDPTGLTPGYYKASVTVTDSGSPPLSTSVDLELQVISAAPDLSANDTDNDGTNDLVEGFGDSDNDGIPNYLDSSQLAPYELQQQASQFDRYSITTRPGLRVGLGNTAFASERVTPLVNTQDIGRVGGGEGKPGPNAADGFIGSGGYYDFIVTGLTANGAAAESAASLLSITVVIPQASPIPKGAVYREYTPILGWRNFSLDEKNQYFSAKDRSGICPPAGDPNYLSGLNEGDTCVQLLLEDGGPNDGDRLANFVIENLGGVTLSPDASTDPLDRGTCGGLFCSGSSGGGGVIGAAAIALFLLYGCMRVSRRRVRAWQ